MAAYASLLSLMRVIHDLETHPSPPISLDKQLLDSITQRITYFEEFLHSYNISRPVADDEEEEAAVDPLEMRIAGAAHAAEDAIEYHIVDCIKHKKKYKKAKDEKIKSILQSVIQEMDSIKKMTLKTKKPPMMQVVHDQVAMTNDVTASDDVLLEIMEKLAGGQLDFQVIPIVGMGGIGKTFLAQTIYSKPLIKEHIDSWDKIQRYFPSNDNGSRVLVTTRLLQLCLQLNNNNYSMRMSFLDKTSSWDLFSKTVFGEKRSCPPELEEIGEEIVDNCRRLPLSIAVVGGVLKKMDVTRAYWESIRDNFSSVVNMDNDKHCLRLLKLSYNHLPVYLKPCFLHMGVFEEDEEICVSTLVHLWVSEGFLKPTDGEALETTARGFLQDLVDRNLILIAELGSTRSLRFCKMHDLVRDMCLKECQKEEFCHFIGQYCNPPQGMINAQRRVVIPKYTSIETIRGDLRFMPHTRSILCDHTEVALCRNLLLLRTLQAQMKSQVSNREFLLNSLVLRYVNLRHLAIEAPMISSFLPPISRLWNLRTLIFSYHPISDPILVADFWKMPQLRHVEFDVCGVFR